MQNTLTGKVALVTGASRGNWKSDCFEAGSRGGSSCDQLPWFKGESQGSESRN